MWMVSYALRLQSNTWQVTCRCIHGCNREGHLDFWDMCDLRAELASRKTCVIFREPVLSHVLRCVTGDCEAIEGSLDHQTGSRADHLTHT
jgi:hypothetical protein